MDRAPYSDGFANLVELPEASGVESNRIEWDWREVFAFGGVAVFFFAAL